MMMGHEESGEIDRFFNKDLNFSISWFPSLKDYYNHYLKNRLDIVDALTNKGKKDKLEEEKKKIAENMMKNPCFVVAHELYDALPIHQFHYNHKGEWCEKIV